MGKIKDLTGEVFGHLTVIEFVPSEKTGAHWLCRCTCGNTKVTAAALLKRGKVVSCGCRKATSISHTERAERYCLEKFGTADLAGLRFGSLTVIEKTRGKRFNIWLCRCDCGKLLTKETYILLNRANLSCGCKKGLNRRKDITGQRFGRLVAIRRDDEKSNNGASFWICRCDCGRETSVALTSLTCGQTHSCGCWQLEVRSRVGSTVGIENSKTAGHHNWFVKKAGERVDLRSGYEVIFAQYLLRHRIPFEYEPRRIKLAPSTVYIPDFYLPDTDTWVEVKGFAAESWLRKRAMFEQAGYKLLVVTRASIASYLPNGISYSTWLRRNGHKYLRNP